MFNESLNKKKVKRPSEKIVTYLQKSHTVGGLQRCNTEQNHTASKEGLVRQLFGYHPKEKSKSSKTIYTPKKSYKIKNP